MKIESLCCDQAIHGLAVTCVGGGAAPFADSTQPPAKSWLSHRANFGDLVQQLLSFAGMNAGVINPAATNNPTPSNNQRRQWISTLALSEMFGGD